MPIEPRSSVARPDIDVDLAGVADLSRGDLEMLFSDFAPKHRPGGFRKGQRVRAAVSRINDSTVFFDVGGKADAAMDRIDVPVDVKQGDVLDAFVLAIKDGEVRLTLTVSGEATRELLDEAKENGIPIQGKVNACNEHGFDVELSGGVRAFCPMGQIDRNVDPDPNAYVGRTLMFKVLDVRGRDAIVSHRSIADEEAKASRGEKLTELQEGEVYEGTVVGLRDFGAFVRLPNGAEGLVHLSNIGKVRLNSAAEALQEGQVVNVRVLSIDIPRQRVNLGIRQAGDTQSEAPREQRGSSSAGQNTFGTMAGLLAAVKPSAKAPAAAKPVIKPAPAKAAAPAPVAATPVIKPAPKPVVEAPVVAVEEPARAGVRRKAR